jgi:hypothetical protein
VRCSSMRTLPNDKSGCASRVALVGNALIARLLLRAYSVRSSEVGLLADRGLYFHGPFTDCKCSANLQHPFRVEPIV